MKLQYDEMKETSHNAASLKVFFSKSVCVCIFFLVWICGNFVLCPQKILRSSDEQ